MLLCHLYQLDDFSDYCLNIGIIVTTGAFTSNFGTSTMSTERLKELTNDKQQDEIFAEVGGVTAVEKNTW